MNIRSTRAIFGLLVLFLFGILAVNCQAQVKYPSPNHPKVQKLSERCVSFLESHRPDGKEAPLAALAIVEHFKRYEGAVPAGHPLVDQVCDKLAAMVDDGSPLILEARETYYPAVALILMCEYNVNKYEPQIMKILQGLIDRQVDNGSFTYLGQTKSDTSQSQFGALAFYVARQHRLPLHPKHVKRLLNFYVDYQARDGSWSYRAILNEPQGKGTCSIHSASLSSVYLLGDLLKLQPRVKDMTNASIDKSLGLPKNVTIYVPPKGDAADVAIDAAWDTGDGPVVQFGRGRLGNCKTAGKQWYQNNFQFPIPKWNTYFMYAMERYCFYKEQAEGSLGSAFASWYDDGIDYIEERQGDNGAIDASPDKMANSFVNTAFCVLFLVRASELISLPPVDTEMTGFGNIPDGDLVEGKDGVPVSSEAERGLKELIAQLSDESLTDRQLQQMTEAMKRAVKEFKQSGDKSRGEITAFLKTMISDKNYYRRLVAIRFLSGQQDMDNVPALLYAMGDPDPTIAVQAHNGLRLISRKFDTFVFEDRGNKDDNLLEFQRLKQQWTKWFLDIRPDAELLE